LLFSRNALHYKQKIAKHLSLELRVDMACYLIVDPKTERLSSKGREMPVFGKE
jgi:hypothetical protein